MGKNKKRKHSKQGKVKKSNFTVVSIKESFNNFVENKFNVALFVPVLFGMFVYLPSLWGDFVFTSYGIVEGNDNIKSFSSALSYFFNSHKGIYSPLMFLSFAIDYKLFGLSPWGYHLTSLVYHLIAVGVFGYLLSLFLSNKGALIGAFFFAVFPLTTDAILSLTGRSFVLAAIFMMLSLIFLIRSDGDLKSLVYCGGFYLLALFSSFYSFVFIFIAPLYMYCFYRGEKIKHAAVYFGVFLVFALFVGVVGELPKPFTALIMEADYVASLKNILTLLIVPLKLLIVPYPLKAHYEPIAMTGSFFNFYTVTSLQFISLTVFLSVVFIKEDRRGLLFITGALFVSLIPFTHLLSGGKYFTESMLYVPTAVFVSIVSLFFDTLKSKKARAFLIAWLIFSSVSLSTATVKREMDWNDNMSLLKDSVIKNPKSTFLLFNLGTAFQDSGNLDKALSAYELCVNLNSNFAVGYYKIARIYSIMGDVDTSLKALKWSIAKGYGTIEQMLNDPELANVRESEDFTNFIDEMRSGTIAH